MDYSKLVNRIEETRPGTRQELYGNLVNYYFREGEQKYSQSRVEATINNYLLDPTNPEYAQEMQDMQAYRIQCKERAKKELGM